MILGFAIIIVVLLGVAIYQLGVFERPKFEYHESLLEQERGHELYTIMATTTEKNIGQHVMRLMNGTFEGINSTSTGPGYLKAATKLYGAPEGAEKLGVGLYFEDPATSDVPR